MATNNNSNRPRITFKNNNKSYLLYNSKGGINPLVQKLVKDNVSNISIPKELFYDNVKKRLRPLFIQDKKEIRYDVRKIIKENPTRINLNNDFLLNLETDRIIKKKAVFKDKKLRKKFNKYEVKNDILYKISRNIFKEETNNKKEGMRLFDKPKRKHENLVVYQIYNYEGENEPSSIEELINIIKFEYNDSFSTKDKTRPLRRVLLKFGRIENGEEPIFRWFPIDSLNNLEKQIDDYANESFGSETEWIESGYGGEAYNLVSMDRLDMSWFRIGLTGKTLEGGASKKAKSDSKYFYCDQPITNNNLCLEGAIRRFLGITISTKVMRRDMEVFSKGFIKSGDQISFSQIPFYEILYKINIEVFEDKQHYQNGKTNANRLIESKFKNEKIMNVLFKDNHYNLIVKPKPKIKELKASEKRELGVFKKPIKSYVEKMKQKKRNKLKEIIVIFDNETIFDRYDDNYLKVYGVSWVVWDMEKNFQYDPKIHNHEPYCYYKSGLGCLKHFIRFLLNPPEGCIYRPVGFNNSRFDNFSFCDVAKSMGVLNNIFMADGSILYCSIEGILPCWDASRFLIGMSLDRACKAYNTCPKKQPELINHYEIQCYYEKNGMEGLTKLIDTNEDYVLYNKLDCLCLLDLIQKMKNATKLLFQENIFDYLTLSSMGYKICDKKWIDEEGQSELYGDNFPPKFNIVKPKTFEDDLFFRKSLTAGRTQSFFGKLDLKTDLAMGDIKSLYPTVMGSYGGNDCPMPYGNYHETNIYVKDKLGIYKCNILHQQTKWKNQDKMVKAFEILKEKTSINLYKQYAPNVIPHRVKDCPLDWDYKEGINNIHLTSVDIEVLKWATEDDNCIEILNGFYWEESRKDLFLDFLDPPKKEKTRQDRLKEDNDPSYNVAIRELCKGISNALSGKLLEKIHSGVSKMFSLKNWISMEKDTNITELEIMDFGGGFSMINGETTTEYGFKKTKDCKKKPSYLGMFIYSYARRLMYKKILSRYLTLYMDTDSACMPLFEWERLCNENNNKLLPQDSLMEVNSGEYGCIEEEVCSKKGCATRLIAISPKNYLVENTNDEKMSKRKMKGVRKTDYYLPLKHFGEIREDATAVIRGLSQDEIRRYREFGCCVNCVENVLKKKPVCSECLKQKNTMIKCYSTPMFEELVKGNKIAVFCSMINRIRYKVGKETDWEFSNNVNHSPSVEELDSIVNGNSINKQGIIMKVKSIDIVKWEKNFKIFKKNNPQIKDSLIKNAYIQEKQRFKNIEETKELKDVFKLKQKYLVKII